MFLSLYVGFPEQEKSQLGERKWVSGEQVKQDKPGSSHSKSITILQIPLIKHF